MRNIRHVLSLNIIIGIVFPILLVATFYFGSERLVSSAEKRGYELHLHQVEKECNTLSRLILLQNTRGDQISTEYEVEESFDENLVGDYEISIGRDTGSIETIAETMANSINGRIVVINNDYHIVLDTYKLNEGERLITRETIDLFDHNGVLTEKLDDNTISYMMGVYDKGLDRVTNVILATSSLSEDAAFISFLKNQKWTLLAIEMILSALIGLMFILATSRETRRFRKDLYNLEQGFTKENKLPEDGFMENYQLSVVFNRILNRYQELERSRQEFVSNVSHELKTPITSMKVLADSLVAMDNVPVELYDEFMQDIVHELDRENQIINDLLALVRMDKSKSDLNIQQTNINELLAILLKRLLPIAQQRNIAMKLTTMRQVLAEVDEVKLSLACNNLIENAVKYNNDGGKVDVSLNADHKFFYIRVKDTGVGIPEDCQEQIFERFYRVDKARSRETGGTGLGLAITRNIILLHKGSIKVHSKPGQGTTFTVRIPLNYIG